MRILRHLLPALLLCSATAMAAPATESSVRQLLTVTQAHTLVERVRTQFDALMSNAIQQSLQGKTPTPKQQQAIDNMKNKMVALVMGELEWAKLEPVYLRLYQESFSEEEVAGMLAFYKTPAGQAVIHKMPVLMQKTMVDVQQRMAALNPKMQKIQERFKAEMSAASK